MKWLVVVGLFVVALAALLALMGGHREAALNVIGSTSIQPFAEILAQEFNKTPRSFVVDVQGGGSTAGLQAVANGVADVGMCSRDLKPEEAAQFTATAFAQDGLAVVVHPSNPVQNLSLRQVAGLFAGDLVNWKQAGGEDRPVRLITREEGSGTREAFQKLVMGKTRISRKALTQESNGAVKELVKHDPCAVGYMSLGLVGQELKAVKIDGVAPIAGEVVSGRYPLARPFLFVTKGPPGERAREFIDFALSPIGRQMIEREGLVGTR